MGVIISININRGSKNMILKTVINRWKAYSIFCLTCIERSLASDRRESQQQRFKLDTSFIRNHHLEIWIFETCHQVFDFQLAPQNTASDLAQRQEISCDCLGTSLGDAILDRTGESGTGRRFSFETNNRNTPDRIHPSNYHEKVKLLRIPFFRRQQQPIPTSKNVDPGLQTSPDLPTALIKTRPRRPLRIPPLPRIPIPPRRPHPRPSRR